MAKHKKPRPAPESLEKKAYDFDRQHEDSQKRAEAKKPSADERIAALKKALGRGKKKGS